MISIALICCIAHFSTSCFFKELISRLFLDIATLMLFNVILQFFEFLLSHVVRQEDWYFIFSKSKKRSARRKTIKAFPSEAAFRWLPSLKACAFLAWRQLRLRPIRRHVVSFAAFTLPSAVLKQFFCELERPSRSTSYRSTRSTS